MVWQIDATSLNALVFGLSFDFKSRNKTFVGGLEGEGGNINIWEFIVMLWSKL